MESRHVGTPRNGSCTQKHPIPLSSISFLSLLSLLFSAFSPSPFNSTPEALLDATRTETPPALVFKANTRSLYPSIYALMVESKRYISQDEFQKHDLWISIQGKIYDASYWLKDHPGGELPLLSLAGRDATDVFVAHHLVFENLEIVLNPLRQAFIELQVLEQMKSSSTNTESSTWSSRGKDKASLARPLCYCGILSKL